MIVINLIIPLLGLVLTFLEYKRILSIKYRLWIFDYGIFLCIAQLIILIVIFIIVRRKRDRMIAFLIFVIYFLILIGLSLLSEGGLFD